jgi:hypothetical protein
MRIIGALLAAVIIGALAGGAMYGMERVGIYLVVMFPLLAGVLIGAGVGVFDRQQRINGLPVIALLGGLVALVVYWGASYYFYIEDNVALVLEEAPRFTREDALELINEFQEVEYGVTGIQGYFADIAAGGMTISQIGDDSGITLEGNVAYAFWIFEAVLLLGAAFVLCMQRGRNAKPTEAAGSVTPGTGGSLADLQQDANQRTAPPENRP